ncbi:Cell wall-associated hydrolase, NlpC family [Psychrobacillus sp. OK028]|uniref:C40 family peptidase n=1 Tax=Psychrobacillus sp. OK028 TaxID=1884359 RepID=UPI0008883F02|nr:NlpC/P60 family protein [Psychrobacillus sp. OK028]SDN62369.1 Cell wall-associated hydrolase, NlpC family [Psychrobacillus sp. OK028]
MKKQFVATTLTAIIGLSTFGGIAPIDMQNIQASAATLNPQNNQVAVEAKADQLIQTAKSLIGKATYSNTDYKPTYPYKFSCATFLMYIFEKNGVDLATYNEDYMMKQGTYVAKDQFQKGDLLFFDSRGGNVPNHVGMYIGDNKIIQMADPTQKIVITDLDSKPYYDDSYITARRVLPTLLPSNPATKGDNIVSKAYSLKDKVTMGTTNNASTLRFTATGFVDYVYKANGVTLGTTNVRELMKKGTTVSKANLKKGDLVFFNGVIGSSTPTMVGIYAGDHRIIVPNSNGVLTRVLFVDYYAKHYITAKRVISGGTTTSVAAPAPKETVSAPTTSTTQSADKVVNFATSLMSKVKFGYSYNESNLTFTSAGFTYYVFKKQGIDVKDKLASRQAQAGTAVSKANLQKGDLLFFSTNNGRTKITQTGIYIGNNEYLSLTTKGSVIKDNLNSTFAKQNYVSARRVLK